MVFRASRFDSRSQPNVSVQYVRSYVCPLHAFGLQIPLVPPIIIVWCQTVLVILAGGILRLFAPQKHILVPARCCGQSYIHLKSLAFDVYIQPVQISQLCSLLPLGREDFYWNLFRLQLPQYLPIHWFRLNLPRSSCSFVPSPANLRRRTHGCLPKRQGTRSLTFTTVTQKLINSHQMRLTQLPSNKDTTSLTWAM